MSDKTGIEWTDATWNPVTGCTKVSPGCDNCYAETFSERFRGTPGHYFEGGFDVQLRPDKLRQPLEWRKPRRIFVNSMSDLFHDDVPDNFIGSVFDTMAAAKQHTFQILTKRPGRMRSLLRRWAEQAADSPHAGASFRRNDMMWSEPRIWPLPNVWLGVSTEDQKWADIRIPILLDTPAAVRFISAEPLLGPVDLAAWVPGKCTCTGLPNHGPIPVHWRGCPALTYKALDWVIVGGESGRNARSMHPEWTRTLRDQCVDAEVPFLFKQWGEWAPGVRDTGSRKGNTGQGFYSKPTVDGQFTGEYASVSRVAKKAAGRELDGRTWDEFPTERKP
ncbi:phage Gp37/Gp68 family protein [Rhodococcus sp. WS3]|uniref:DUF5131 family protein n=1 Tax=Rhodococcus sp. WS3 TaxID=2486271 RepID=UPI001144CB74|nr:phage Gp37/Gp68 family protein [Rhodococcus sp. WS3]ROZ49366.1 phage Gp37/Gp68 family protein [Rhodococcus sp. WS3]